MSVGHRRRHESGQLPSESLSAAKWLTEREGIPRQFPHKYTTHAELVAALFVSGQGAPELCSAEPILRPPSDLQRDASPRRVLLEGIVFWVLAWSSLNRLSTIMVSSGGLPVKSRIYAPSRPSRIYDAIPALKRAEKNSAARRMAKSGGEVNRRWGSFFALNSRVERPKPTPKIVVSYYAREDSNLAPAD
jgi:hypothetical protein